MTPESKQLLAEIFAQVHGTGIDYAVEDLTEEDIEVVSRFAVQIAEKAVGEEIEARPTPRGKAGARDFGINILSRIKNETGGKP